MDLTPNMRLEVQMARNDAFVWNVSTWTGYRWAGPADTATSGIEWRNILSESNSINITRGAKRDGLGLELEAGILSATVNDATVDPNTNPYIKMGTPIRLMYAGRNNVLVNPSARINTSDWLKTSGRTLVRDTTTGYVGPSSFKLTTTTSGDWAYTGDYTAAPGEVWTASVWVKGTGSAAIRVGYRDAALTALTQPESATVTLTGSWQRISVTGTAPASTAKVFLRVVQKTTGAYDMWLDGAMLEKASTLGTYTELKGDTAVFTGVIKTVKVTYKKSKPQVFITAVDRVKDIANINRSGVVSGTFAQRVGDLLGKHGIPYVVSGSSALVLAQNAYDSTLSNHLQLAANTERGLFYVDRANVIQARGAADVIGSPTLMFTDQQGALPSDVEYVDIQVAYDSEAMSNDIYVNNLTWALNAELEPVSVNTKYGPYQNVTSIVTYGAYNEEVDTNFSTQAEVDAFAAAVLAAHDAPELRVDSVRFNAKDYLDKAASLEVFDTVNVEYSNEAFHIGEDFRVLNIEHNITARNDDHTWIVDVGLISIGGS